MTDRWTFYAQELRLTCGARERRLRPRAAAFLDCLLRRKGQIVSHAQLLEEVWGGISVTPDLVREYVFHLRSALGDDPQHPRYIETVRGRGIRLVGDIEHAHKVSERRRASLLISRPFAPDGAFTAMGDEFYEDLLFCFSGMTDIAVLGAGTQETHDAEYLLRTRLAFNRDGMEAIFRLVERATEETIFSRRLSGLSGNGGDREHIAAIAANEIASWRGAIIRSEAAKARRVSSDALDAYNHYCLALYYERQRDPSGAAAALRHIERSLELEPQNPRGHLLLWHMLERPFILFGERLSADTWRVCSEAMAQAHALDPDDPQILVNVCGERARHGDFGGAEIALSRAAEIGRLQAEVMSPSANAYAMIIGDVSAARTCLDRAHSLNPTVKDWLRFTTARVRFFSQDFKGCELSTGTNPDILPLSLFRCLSLAMQERMSEAKAAYRLLREKFPHADLEEYAARFPISAPPARELYDEAVKRL